MEDGMTSWIGHTLSSAAIVGTIFGLFPPIAAVAAFIWYMVQLWESKTVQRWVRQRRQRKINRLKTQISVLEAIEHDAHLPPRH